MGVRDRDNGFKALSKRLASTRSGVVTVGVHSDAGAEANGASTVAVASYHEFGTGTIPSRSFVRAWVDANGSVVKDLLRKGAAAVVAGKRTQAQVYAQIGAFIAAGMQARMSAGIPPPLKAPRPSKGRPKAKRSGKALPPSPLGKQFGGHTPLIDTGHLRASITYKVEGV